MGPDYGQTSEESSYTHSFMVFCMASVVWHDTTIWPHTKWEELNYSGKLINPKPLNPQSNGLTNRGRGRGSSS